ncbi:hypothetical protein NDU88_003083 [Pleurodeles waltl]|uniref:Uncharacterized protein n=1 Tax=Pleurodeles waltl TaxID=8319 RepID=A0AAV7UD03_PLEWA|nr:hypothetical protein NDU88_003083 [Pleurodeles waltl]
MAQPISPSPRDRAGRRPGRVAPSRQSALTSSSGSTARAHPASVSRASYFCLTLLPFQDCHFDQKRKRSCAPYAAVFSLRQARGLCTR